MVGKARAVIRGVDGTYFFNSIFFGENLLNLARQG